MLLCGGRTVGDAKMTTAERVARVTVKIDLQYGDTEKESHE